MEGNDKIGEIKLECTCGGSIINVIIFGNGNQGILSGNCNKCGVAFSITIK